MCLLAQVSGYCQRKLYTGRINTSGAGKIKSSSVIKAYFDRAILRSEAIGVCYIVKNIRMYFMFSHSRVYHLIDSFHRI